MVWASQTRRSDGGTQSGTHGDKNLNHLPVSRNRNTNYDKDSNDADHQNRSNSNSISTHNTPPEPQPRNDDRGSTNEQECGSRSNTDRNGAEDPGSQKHKLHEDISDAVSSGSLFKKLNSRYVFFFYLIWYINWRFIIHNHRSSSNLDLYALYSWTHSILRFLGPTLDIKLVFVSRARLASSSHNSSGSHDSSDPENASDTPSE